jgi:polyhydroxyalkanoate synthesis regulator phasin
MWRKAGNKMKLKDGLRTIFLAGVGAVAITGEKASVIIDDLVKKGELTVEEGKVLNEEFKKKAKENLNPDNIQKNVKEVIASIDEMTKEQRDAIRSMLDRLDKKEKEEAKEEAEEVVDAIVEDAVGDDTVDAPDAEIDQPVVDAVAEGDAEALADALETVDEIVEEAVADDVVAPAEDVDLEKPVADAVAEE